MLPNALTLPFAVNQHDSSGLFGVDATVTVWREERPEPGQTGAVTLTLGGGTLHDADKGEFPLEGVELTVRVADGRIEPVGVPRPGVLSELQQDGLLDAVSIALNALNRSFAPPSQSDMP